jgi:hypothetical protein
MFRKLGIAAAVVLVFVAGGFALIRLAGAGATEFRLDGPVLHISGPVTGASAERLQRLLEQNPGIEVVSLGAIPGADDVSWVAGMGRLIRAAGLETRVVGPVVNDGIFLFLGGTVRSVDGGSLILQSDAVQRQAGVATDASVAADADRQGFVAAMLGGAEFADFMAETRAAQDTYVLTGDDIARFGLETAN